MHESTIAKRYTIALADLAAGQHLLEDVGQALTSLRDLLDSAPEIRAFLVSPVVGVEQQMRVVESFIEEAKPGQLLANFLRLLVKKRRMALIDEIIAAFLRNMEERKGRVTVQVRSAVPLAAEQAGRLESVLSRRIQKEVHLDVSVDPALLGGVVIRVGSLMMDYSLRSRFSRLKAYMMG